ncbi:Protein of unknown function, partial [Gryllus bimaculatus]
VRTKEDRKKSPVQEEARLIVGRERSRSDGRGSSSAAESVRPKIMVSSQSDESKQSASGGGKTVFRSETKGKISVNKNCKRHRSRDEASCSHSLTAMRRWNQAGNLEAKSKML